MAITINYTKSQYMAKITELEGYYNMLNQHLTKMQELKDHMYEFWNDPNAQKAGQLLAIQMRMVQSTMDRTNDTILFYKTTVEKMGGSNTLADDLLEAALGLLASSKG